MHVGISMFIVVIKVVILNQSFTRHEITGVVLIATESLWFSRLKGASPDHAVFHHSLPIRRLRCF